MATRSKRKMDNSQSINSTGFSQFDTQMELESGNRLSDNEASSYSEDIIESGSFMNSSNKGQKGYKIDDILSKIGFGYIQWYSYAALIWWNIAQSMYSYNLPYLELMPDLLCKEQNEFGEWTVDDICANSGFQHWKIDWNSETTIHNWMTDNLTLWIGGFKIGLIGSWYYAGVLIATILSQTSDYVGRKRFIQIWNFWGVIWVYSLYFWEGLNMRMLWCFALGVLNCIYFWSYSYLLEISPNEWRSFANFLFLLTEFFIPKMLGSMYFFSGGKEWTSLFSVSLVLAPLGLFMARFMPESPVYYMNNQNLKMAKTQLQIMADVNERKIPSKYKIIDSSTEQFEEHKVDKWKYFKTGNHCLLLLTMIILLSHSNFNLSMWIFFEKIYRSKYVLS